MATFIVQTSYGSTDVWTDMAERFQTRAEAQEEVDVLRQLWKLTPWKFRVKP